MANRIAGKVAPGNTHGSRRAVSMNRLANRAAAIGLPEHREVASELGRNLHKFRSERNLTQLDVALATGASERAMVQYEQGQVLPSTLWLVRFCFAFKVRASELVEEL